MVIWKWSLDIVYIKWISDRMFYRYYTMKELQKEKWGRKNEVGDYWNEFLSNFVVYFEMNEGFYFRDSYMQDKFPSGMWETNYKFNLRVNNDISVCEKWLDR